MCLTVVQSPLHRGANSGSIDRIDAVKIKADVEVVDLLSDTPVEFVHHVVDAIFIDVFHCKDLHSVPQNVCTLTFVESAKSDNRNVLRLYFLKHSADPGKY